MKSRNQIKLALVTEVFEKLQVRNQIKLAVDKEDYSSPWTTEPLMNAAAHEPSLSLSINS